ncbi:hypothetical protein BJY01DRAFT_220669 [Aspergillus pseudoustus]|uniref:Phosphatidylglycerol lysyltransferase C-terminal domain-containing protein n=1 Tax=Aspergillus pseudoustus TaxID=1810923 RepID=A0ABR4JCE2_9EURO
MADTRIHFPENAGTVTDTNKRKGLKKERKQRSQNGQNATEKPTKQLLADTVGLALSTSRSSRSITDTGSDGGSEGMGSRFLSIPLSDPMDAYSFSESTYSFASTSNTLRPSSYETSSETASRYTSDGSSEDIPNIQNPYSKYSATNRVVSLSGKASIRDVEILAIKYGLVSHMGLLDPSYSVFVTDDRTGGICFKTLYRVAVVMGNPLCEPDDIHRLMYEFDQYRRRRRWDMSILGAGEESVRYFSGIKKKSTILQFGKERALNPLTNEVIHETNGKRIVTQCRQLLDPSKGGIKLETYIPSLQDPDPKLERDLAAIYDEWRLARNKSGKPQAFITEYDPFLMPNLMTYIYARGPDGKVNGFAGLRWIGPKGGYHIDPCIAAPGARKGISDLLLFASMAYLRQSGVSHLSLGYEPSESLEPITEMSPTIAHLTQRIYRHTFRRLPISGKRAYFDKFKPDDEQDAPVYLIFPSRIPELRQVVAVAHVANISIRRLFFGDKRKTAS